MRAVKIAGVSALVLASGYVLVAAVWVWADYAWNQAQGGSSYFGQSAFDASVAAVLLGSVALAAVSARAHGRARMLVTAAAVALPLSLLAVVWAAFAGGGF